MQKLRFATEKRSLFNDTLIEHGAERAQQLTSYRKRIFISI